MDELPFYCPALAWNDSRPWGCHGSRLRRRESLPPLRMGGMHEMQTVPSLPPLRSDNSTDGAVQIVEIESQTIVSSDDWEATD